MTASTDDCTDTVLADIWRGHLTKEQVHERFKIEKALPASFFGAQPTEDHKLSRFLTTWLADRV